MSGLNTTQTMLTPVTSPSTMVDQDLAARMLSGQAVVTTSDMNQLGSGQDFVTHGKIEGEFDYLVVADGHGKGKITDLLSSPTFDWDGIVKHDSATTVLASINKAILLNVLNTYNDGSTLTIVKIFPKEIVVYWMGDSQAQIKINDTHYKTKNDNAASVMKEIEEGTVSVTKPHWSLNILNDTDVTVTEAYYFNLLNGEKLAMIRALGHEYNTVQTMHEMSLPIKLEDEVRILVATDGLWDVVYEPELLSKFPEYDAMDFTKLASDRWLQEWNYIVPSIFKDAHGNTYPTEKTKLDSADDVGVVVYKRLNMSS